MSGWKPNLIALVLFAWLGTGMAAKAQGIVPGGWSPQFSYQTFSAPGAAGFGVSAGGVYPGYGYGVTFPGMSPYGSGLAGPYVPAVPPPYNYYNPAQTVNAVDPLIGAIRRSTGRKGSR